jgi:uncharacterized membrane protein
MERMLVVVFEHEKKAYEGSHALEQLDSDGGITVHAEAVIKKNADGRVEVKQSGDDVPARTLGGTAIGSLIGLLGGPIGLGIGAAVGTLAGSIWDLNVAGVNAEFVDDVATVLTPGKCAVLADISEEWVTPVDTRMEALGGTVFRAARKDIEHDQISRDITVLRIEMDQLRAEHAAARADRKAKLKAQMDKLNAKLQGKVDQANRRSEQIRSETEAKIQALRKKAEKAHGDVKATIEARVKRIREHHEQSQAKLKHLVAGQLTAAAAKLEQ